MAFELDAEEIRVLGALIEKELTTPDYYPLSLNALKNACNQTTNRDPIVSYDDAIVHAALKRLIEKRLVWDAHVGRVAKYGQNLSKQLNLVPREAIVLALLLLRGPQTVGELRGRSGRAHAFADLNAVQEVLTDLVEWDHVQQLPRQAGRKESRYGHLFSQNASDLEIEAPAQPSSSTGTSTSHPERVVQLEQDLNTLREEFETLKQAFQDFKAQF